MFRAHVYWMGTRYILEMKKSSSKVKEAFRHGKHTGAVEVTQLSDILSAHTFGALTRSLP